MTVTEALLARRAVPSFDPTVTITKDELEVLIDTACLAPSSMNLQPWEFLICHSQEDKERLQKVAMNQKKVTEASAAIAVIGNTEFYKHAEAVADSNIEKGYFPAERKPGFIEMAHGSVGNPQALHDEAVRSSNLWAMAFMLAATEAGWDTGPMGGFHADALAEEFGLPESRFATLIITIGKRNPDIKMLERNNRFSAKELSHYGNW
jgi:putative NAD(P)H nitroreductase